MSDVYCYAEDVPIADSYAFRLPVLDNNSTLHVPANSIEKYKKASVWNKFGNIIALTDEELKIYDDDNHEGIVNPEPDEVIEGVYLVQPESYRINKGNNVSYGKSYEILITKNSDGTYCVDDLFGGWYSQRAGYGLNYAMNGNIAIAVDGTVSLKDSYVAGWGDSFVNLTGSYDAARSTFTIEAEYVDGMKFFQTWIKDHQVIKVDGINYRIGDNYTASVVKGKYSGDLNIPNDVSYGGITYSVMFLDGAFSGCTDITSVIIPNSVTSLGCNTFAGCTGLMSVTIPNSVTSIDEGVFKGCSGLNSVNIPNSVVSIGYLAFENCYNLSNLTLSENLTTIGQCSFIACNSLKSLIIPASVLKIGNDAFSECENLESVKVESENTKYDSRNDCNAIIETYSDRLILGCKNTVIPQDVTIIGVAAFSCIKDLDYYVIPNSVTSIESSAFWNCTGMRNFYCYAKTVPSTHQTAFNDTPIHNATLHVPAASVESYKQMAPWSGFGKIVALTDNDPKPTGVNTLKVDNTVYPINTYTIEGRHISNPQRGLNIIRMSDGTAKKVLLK